MYRQSEKKLVKQQYLLHMSAQYGELRPASGWDPFGRLGHPSYFQRLPRLGSVTARHVVAGASQTLRRWIEGATYVREGDHHVGHWPTFVVWFCNICIDGATPLSWECSYPITRWIKYLLIISTSVSAVPRHYLGTNTKGIAVWIHIIGNNFSVLLSSISDFQKWSQVLVIRK